ncbi:MAG: DUF481 domain-containing protein [Sulfurimonas sp.]|jgi:putative salt-induced outer membrane protein|nr:DUF481 domain-containing protein [Sulfurimonadaceae bacterium]
MKKIALSLALLSSLVLADDKLEAKAELGYTKTSGNTDTSALNFNAKAKQTWDPHFLSAEADAQYSKTDNDETANRWMLELQYGYNYTEDLAFGYLVGYKKDKFSGYKHQFYTGPMAQYKVWATEKSNLDVELALLYAKDKLDNGVKEDYMSYRTRAVFDYKLLETLKFEEDFSHRGSFEDANNYFITSKTSLVNRVTEMVSAALSYRVDYANIVPADKLKTDKTLMLNLIFNYN